MNQWIENLPIVYLVRKTDGIEPSLIGDIPTTVHVVNGKTVALGPVTVKLAHIVVTRRIIIGWLELLGLVEPVCMSKLDLTELLLASRATKTSNFRDVTGITCKDGDPSTHGGNASSQTDGGHTLNRNNLRLGRDGRLRVEHDGLLAHDGLLDDVGLLGDNIALLNALNGLRSNGWLLETRVSTSFDES